MNAIVQQALQQQAAALHQQMNAAVAAAVAAAPAPAAAAAGSPVAAGMDAAQFAAIIAQVQQQNAKQMQQIVAQIAPQTAPRAQPRFAAPTTYDGRSGAFDEWKADMLRQFAWYNTPADDARIRVASAHLTGAAGDWWTSRTDADRPQTWNALIAALEARFQPINSSELARSKLYELTQGKKTVNEYVDTFRRLLGRLTNAQGQVDMAASDQLQHFRRGLRPAIALQLDVQGITTLDTAINVAVRVGSRLDIANGSSSSSSGSSPQPMELDALLGVEGLEAETSSPAASSSTAPVTRADLTLLINAMRDNRRSTAGAGSSNSSNSSNNRGRVTPGGLPRISHLSPEQVKEYMDAGKCFGCGSKDHRSRQCPKRKVGADGRVSWSN